MDKRLQKITLGLLMQYLVDNDIKRYEDLPKQYQQLVKPADFEELVQLMGGLE